MTRTLLRWVLPTVACLCAAAVAAQTYPAQPIKLIVPYPPGGNTDIVARLYAQKLSERVGQPVVIDNRGGAAGTLGVGIAAKSPNDGYTLVIGDLGSLVIGPLSKPGFGYDPQKDFAPVSLVSTVSIVVTANPKSGINSMPDLLARAKAQPGKLNAGTGGQAGPGISRSSCCARWRVWTSCTCRSRAARQPRPRCWANRSTSSSTAPRWRRSREAG